MNKPTMLLLVGIQAALSACAMFTGVKPVLTRRFQSYGSKVDSSSLVKVTVFSVPILTSGSEETGIIQLAPAGQAELVKAIAAQTQTQGVGALVQALALPFERPQGTPSFRDLTKVHRRLVFSLDHVQSGPADRVSEARIIVTPATDSTHFVGWNRIENDYRSVELGRLSLSQSRTAGGELGLTLPVFSATPKVSASSTNSLQEDVNLAHQRTALTGSLTRDSAELFQEGDVGIDLTGNVTADFDIEVEHGGTTTIFIPQLPQQTDSAACAQPMEFERQTIQFAGHRYPGDSIRVQPVVMNVRLNYVLRHVLRGESTVIESDDAVWFLRGTTTRDGIQILPAAALHFSVFGLRLSAQDSLFIEGAAPGARATSRFLLQFATFGDAVATLNWLRTCKTVDRLFVNGARPLDRTELNRVYVWRQPVNF